MQAVLHTSADVPLVLLLLLVLVLLLLQELHAEPASRSVQQQTKMSCNRAGSSLKSDSPTCCAGEVVDDVCSPEPLGACLTDDAVYPSIAL
jgi:hypothetical protein